MTRTRIFGPPGTGKTTRLIALADKYLEHGAPHRIAYLAFTRKAAQEAADRITYSDSALPYFRTIHSLCYWALGVTRGQVMSRRDMRAFGRWLGIDLDGRVDEMGMPIGDRLGDRCLHVVHMARNRLVQLREQWQESGEGVAWHEVERFARGLAAWKARYDKVDFTDMLERFSEKHAPDLDVLIVDEAQDLTPLQWRVIEVLAAKADEVYVAGDDDQAVYHWAGADVSLLIDGSGEAHVLDKSYRLPRRIYDEAAKLTRRIGRRVAKDWSPAAEGGEVRHVTDVSDLPLEQGSWYLLARNRYLLHHFTDELRRRGLLYTTQAGPSIEQGTLDAIRCWEALRKGREMPASLTASAMDLMLAGDAYARGGKARLATLGSALVDMGKLQKDYGVLTNGPWFEVMGHLGREDIDYLRACLRHGEQLSKPRIHVSTIHGVKGGEADHVAILPDMSGATWDGFQRFPDHELRVFYVAVTRARQTLTWLHPQSNRAMVV